MAYKLKDRKEKMLYKGSVYELTLQWDRESVRQSKLESESARTGAANMLSVALSLRTGFSVFPSERVTDCLCVCGNEDG